MKSTDISIKNLNPIFLKPLEKFDELHKNILGTQAVVTSVDTGKHWGKLKKHMRPDNWEIMTEAEVRKLSNSKHYTKPLCDALDFRRRNPDTESDLNYYDDLTESEQELFKVKMFNCFPDEYFDVVFSRLCIHIELDPDFDVRKPKGLTNEDLEPRTKVSDEYVRRYDKTIKRMLEEKKPIELPQLPIWKKSGFKRKLGGIVLLIGGLLSLIPQTAPIGQGLLAVGGAVGITGAGHGMMKNRKKEQTTKIDTIAILRILADILIWLFSRKRGETK
ncbi:MAG TPA: hypothetical protein ENH87_02145 [Pricia antarctica]|uniref:Uncharacterized protein n=1 Tax=Pricia antarctica TaxID=641691 RepID=A0A831QMJ3_9FLAO|nr:hypothetical protein [Pricia antarctica]